MKKVTILPLPGRIGHYGKWIFACMMLALIAGTGKLFATGMEMHPGNETSANVSLASASPGNVLTGNPPPGNPSTDNPSPGSNSAYREWVEDWHRNRIEALKADRGWLRVAGLYWLDDGEQAFGSGEWARVRFPEGTIPPVAGIFEVTADTVVMTVAGNLDIRDERNRRVRQDTIFMPDRVRELKYRNLRWFVVQREDMLGIRLFDDNSSYLRNFEGIDRYEIDEHWRVEASFVPAETGTGMLIENVLGQWVEWKVAGRLRYYKEGDPVEMIALGTGDRLFIPFSDATSGNETYVAGRYVYIDRPEPGQPAIIDFNVSYNPPCAINPHTTCPLPPEQNRLQFPIRAGEKKVNFAEFLQGR